MVMPTNWNLARFILVDQATMVSETPEAGEIFIVSVNDILQTKDESAAVRTYVTLDATQVLTGKTMDGDLNTFQDIALSAIKTVGANTNRLLSRDGSGVISDATSPSFANANHIHEGASTGGQLNASNVFSAGLVPLARGGLGASLASSGPGTLVQTTNGGAVSTRLDKLNGTVAPSVNDDAGDGYTAPGSRWYDVTNDKEYVLMDSTIGAAVWVETTATGGGGGGDADDITYTPTTLADWDGGSDPGDVEQALDQLAERVTDLEGAGSGATGYIKLSDVKAYNVDGGTFTSGGNRTRDLNTEYDPGGHCTLSTNQFTLVAGTYRIRAHVPGFAVNNHFAWLYNVTDAAIQIMGTSAYSRTTALTATTSHIVGEFTIASSKTFEIQHRCDTTASGNGFGTNSSVSGFDSIYTVVELEKVA